MSAGAAWVDFDGDGWLDAYLVQSGPFPPRAGESSAVRAGRAAEELRRVLGSPRLVETQ